MIIYYRMIYIIQKAFLVRISRATIISSVAYCSIKSLFTSEWKSKHFKKLFVINLNFKSCQKLQNVRLCEIFRDRKSIVTAKIYFRVEQMVYMPPWFLQRTVSSPVRSWALNGPWQEIKRGEVRSRRLIYEESDEPRANGATHLPACQLLAGAKEYESSLPDLLFPFVISRLTPSDTAGGGESKTISLWKITGSTTWNFRSARVTSRDLYTLSRI